MKHTPGPWKVMYSTPEKGESALAVWTASTEEGFKGSPICKVSPESLENDEDRANAQLIAAAPELLEALVSLYTKYKNEGLGKDKWYGPVMDAAKQAITKATGGQS